MDGSLNIMRYEDAHRPGLLRLWKRYFGAWSAARLEQRWSWQFEQNPFRGGAPAREPVILVAVAGGEVVGHISGIPVPMLLEGREEVVLAASGLVVEDRHRLASFSLVRALVSEGPVLGSAMSEGASKMMSKCGVGVIGVSRARFVYPLRYSGELAMKVRRRLPGLLTPLVSAGLCRGAAWWYVPRGKPRPRRLPARVSGGVGEGIRRLGKFGAEYDALWSTFCSPLRWSVNKSSRYMNWRYFDCPTVDPVCLGVFGKGGDLCAVGVGIRRARTDRSGRPCLLNGEIAELMSLDPTNAATEHLLAALMHALDEGRVDSIDACYMHGALHPLLERTGFRATESVEFAAALGPHPSGESSAKWGDGSECYYTAGDGDGLYSSGV